MVTIAIVPSGCGNKERWSELREEREWNYPCGNVTLLVLPRDWDIIDGITFDVNVSRNRWILVDYCRFHDSRLGIWLSQDVHNSCANIWAGITQQSPSTNFSRYPISVLYATRTCYNATSWNMYFDRFKGTDIQAGQVRGATPSQSRRASGTSHWELLMRGRYVVRPAIISHSHSAPPPKEPSWISINIRLQCASIVCPTGNGEKFSSSQAQLGQATCLAVA